MTERFPRILRDGSCCGDLCAQTDHCAIKIIRVNSRHKKWNSQMSEMW